MEVGWGATNPSAYKRDRQLYHPRLSSKETEYANALILGPRHT